MIEQQVYISHACSSLGLRNVSEKWLLESCRQIDELGFPGTQGKAKDKINAILYIMSLIQKNHEPKSEKLCLLDRMSLYKGGLSISFTRGCNEEPRLLVHFALAALQKRLLKSAMAIFQKITEITRAPTPPVYYDELLHAIDARIIIQVEDNDMDGALQEMHHRLDVVSRWVGDSSLELANNLHRLGCFYSALGRDEESLKYFEESLHIGEVFNEYDGLNSMRLLAVTYDRLNDVENAKMMYKCALSMEEDTMVQARMMNALSFLLIRIGGQSRLVADYLEKSIQIQQNDENGEGTSSDLLLLLDTMILFGNFWASERIFSQAIDWYESALSSNPEKSVIHPSNLRALYNKGLTLFRSGDLTGANNAFRIIIEEVDKNPTAASSEAASILNSIGSIYYRAKHFLGAVEHFTQCLSLRHGGLSPGHRAGTLCNLGSAHCMMQNYEESEKYFKKALTAVECTSDTSPDTRAKLLCNLGYILYKRKDYIRAQKTFSEGENVARKIKVCCLSKQTHSYFLHFHAHSCVDRA